MKNLIVKRFQQTALGIIMLLPLVATAQKEKFSYGRPNYFRAYDKTGVNVFETTKVEDEPYEGMKIRFGAGFTQQYQNLKHENNALNNTGVGANRLFPLASGFMTAQANLFTDVQLYDGIRLNLTTYLSARHHNEAWVKGGYIQFDKLPFKGKFWEDVMKVATIKVGHMEINYGDQHFRRSDGGHTLYNPFMDNYIMDAFTTEIGGEIYAQKNGFLGMIGITGGMLKGSVDSAVATVQDDNTKRAPSIILKGGFDKQLKEKLRVRLTGSLYHNSSNAGSGITLYGGDRTGSNYNNVMEKYYDATGKPNAYTAMYSSGRFNPGFSKTMTAFQFNGFVKAGGFEFFGTYENANGRSKTETEKRNAQQYAVEGIYRFAKNEKLFIGARYNAVNAELVGYTEKVDINRTALAAGWFLTNNILLKAELVNQKYEGFKNTDFRSGGKFNGWVMEAIVGF